MNNYFFNGWNRIVVYKLWLIRVKIFVKDNIKRVDLLYLKVEFKFNECLCCINGKKIIVFKVKLLINVEKDNIFLNVCINNFDVRILNFFFRWKLNIFLCNKFKRCCFVWWCLYEFDWFWLEL